MHTQDPRWTEIARLQAELIAALPALKAAHTNASLGLGPSSMVKPSRSKESSPVAAAVPTTPRPRYPQGHFGPQHGLSPEEAWQAEKLLRQKKPFRGPHAQQQEAARKRGIIAAVKAGRVGNSTFGRSLHGHRGGNVMRNHALGHLRSIAPLGSQAATAARANKKAVAHWEQTGEVLPLEQYDQSAPAMDAWTAGRPFMMW